MKNHIEGDFKVDWEPLAQVSPAELEKALEGKNFPGPFKTSYRGNGHLDLYDSEGFYIAHVFCWDEKDNDIIGRVLENSKK